MKCAIQLLKFAFVALFCSGLIFSCKKNDDEDPVDPPPPTDTTGVVLHGDTILNHLQFLNATKITGAIPKGPSGSSLKISFKDTLYLSDKVKRPIKFLHKDTTQNVAGVFLHVTGGTGGTFYYDVPEAPDMADSDTVSVILIGVDPEGLTGTGTGVPPAGPGSPVPFTVTIVPYGDDKQPIGTATKPGIIEKPKVNPTGSCSLVTGDYWDWDMSYIPLPDSSGKFAFYNDPKKIWGLGGQNIRGCCANGVSSYSANCSVPNQRYLNFQTIFGDIEEIYQFFGDGTFVSYASRFYTTPEPQLSNFCGSGQGVVTTKNSAQTKNGTWSIGPASPLGKDSLYLDMLVTFSTTAGNAGYYIPRGIIHQLDCKVGTLVVIRRNSEQPNNRDADMYIYYSSRKVNGWHPFA